MFDPPHLLKVTRNNFFNYLFKSVNKIAEKIHLENFIKQINLKYIDWKVLKLSDITKHKPE